MSVRISSAAVAPRDRFEWFTDVIARSLAPTAIRCEDPAAFRAEATLLDLGAVQVSTFTYGPLSSRRTPALIRRGDPEQYQLALVTGSPMWISQRRGDSGPVSGDLVLWDTSHPYEAGAPGEDGDVVRAVVMQLPRSALPFRADRVDRLLAQRIPAGRGMGAVLAQFLGSVGAHADGCGERELARLGSVALGLATACLAERLDAYDDLPAEAREEVLLRQIDAFIEHNLGDPELTPKAVAARHHISLRRLQQLFQGRREGVAAAIRRRRLEHCRADLLRPELLGRPVHVIAARWGFTSAAVFSRAFRQAYGLSPSELRHTAAPSAAAGRDGVVGLHATRRAGTGGWDGPDRRIGARDRRTSGPDRRLP
ncbi:helix-turn-helix domain-containing protein [Streptomyces sp. NBC_00249]|uniref:AraC-like ligand-binding domain-containing protein n=1 Tax=Streptomyces sp. NBC_00249 TaxID=2975690 RepID=UPI00225BB182|nr:helix-turn-helix domain-containing protein [Streptomyces sp. NBC_00249]MCX5198668.1 helix-turn-helix domain-containing protein [Streptomyces sp. NBC_00249]